MSAITRRRRFVILIILCCVLYFLFSWYIHKEDTKSINIVSDSDQDFAVSLNQSPEYIRDELPENEPRDSFKDFDTITEKLEIPTEYSASEELESLNNNLERLQHIRKSKDAPENLFSNSRVTFPEDAPSGPTDDGEYELDQEIIQHAGSNVVTEPLPTQAVINPEKDIEIYSAPLEDSEKLVITKSPTPAAEYPDSKGSPELQTLTNIPATKNPALIIDTSGCKIPKMDPFDPTVKDLIEVYKNRELCNDKPLFMTPEANGVIHLNVSVLKDYYDATPDDMQCWYQGIIRKREDPGHIRENDYKTTGVRELTFDIPMEYEYIAAKCFFRDNHTHEQYLPLVKLKEEVEKERSKIKPPSPLNVILLGIDSVSKLNFMRHFIETKAFIKQNMNTFDMKGYTKVGDNTFPNLVPMLTGHFVEHFWNESVRDTFLFDNISLIWKDYARHGYRTFYAEDSPYSGTFNYIKRGFLDPPTDYYYRPLALAIMQSDLRKEHQDTPCLNSELETDLIYDYLKNFVKTMKDRPLFAFAMVSILTHDFLNSASYADPPAARILKVLQDLGAFNNSAIVIFSDHGLRFGAIRHTYIGKFEERMPFMYIHFPDWFLKQHPEFKKNLSTNQERLMTLFDLHATMKHLLHLNGEPMEKEEHGLSLLTEIPENRTCEDASILQHWCPCNSFNSVPVTDPIVISVSQALVNHINDLLTPHKDVCSTLEVANVTDARLGMPNSVVLKFQKSENVVENRTVILGEEPSKLGDYLLTLTVKPGGAIFEGTVRYDEKTQTSKIMGISRINMYGKTSWCINSQKLKLYCYCKSQNVN